MFLRKCKTLVCYDFFNKCSEFFYNSLTINKIHIAEDFGSGYLSIYPSIARLADIVFKRILRRFLSCLIWYAEVFCSEFAPR
jgi:hypothetical protein